MNPGRDFFTRQIKLRNVNNRRNFTKHFCVARKFRNFPLDSKGGTFNMNTTIISVALGFANAYLVQSEAGVVLVDTGIPESMKPLDTALAENGLAYTDIKLIVITHGHADHTGQAAELAERCGAPVLMQEADAGWLIDGKGAPANPVTTGAKMMMGLLKRVEAKFKVTPLEPQILPNGGTLSLQDYGIDGVVMHTPGHTPGSLSLVLDDGRAMVGDMAMNNIPVLRWGAGLPSIAADMEQVKASWRNLLKAGVKEVYPGHGKPFGAAVIAKQLTGN